MAAFFGYRLAKFSTIIGQRKTALAHTPWRQVLLAISTRNRLILGHFLEHGARWPILMHAGEKDDLTDSKYVPLQCRTFEQFDSQVFHCAFLSGRFVLQQVRDNKPAKSWKCSGSYIQLQSCVWCDRCIMSELCFLVMPECRASLSLSLMKSSTYIVTQ